MPQSDTDIPDTDPPTIKIPKVDYYIVMNPCKIHGRGFSSGVRVFALHAKCRGFKSPILHFFSRKTKNRPCDERCLFLTSTRMFYRISYRCRTHEKLTGHSSGFFPPDLYGIRDNIPWSRDKREIPCPHKFKCPASAPRKSVNPVPFP